MGIKIGILLLLVSFNLFGQKKCCDSLACKARAEGLAQKITFLVAIVGKCSVDPDPAIKKRENGELLIVLKGENNALYTEFIKTVNDVKTFINDVHQDECFMNALPEGQYVNIYNWLAYFDDPVKFSSAEFCSGFKRRVEINQGAANIFTSCATNLGSLRGYVGYTFGKKNNCGGKLRLMAGPAFFLRGNTSYFAFSSKLGVRISDVDPKNFPLGNINLFGEFTSNFNHFQYAALGAEVELGPIGLNFAINQDIYSNRQGFLIGFIFANRKIKK